jgi:hypothetical protein
MCSAWAVEKSRAALAKTADYLDGSFQVVRSRLRMRVSGRRPHPVAARIAVVAETSGRIAKQVLHTGAKRRGREQGKRASQ